VSPCPAADKCTLIHLGYGKAADFCSDPEYLRPGSSMLGVAPSTMFILMVALGVMRLLRRPGFTGTLQGNC
jgi:hypothetical protein